MKDDLSLKHYERPLLTVLGSFETLTQGAGDGANLDAFFPTGTSLSELTFS